MIFYYINSEILQEIKNVDIFTFDPRTKRRDLFLSKDESLTDDLIARATHLFEKEVRFQLYNKSLNSLEEKTQAKIKALNSEQLELESIQRQRNELAIENLDESFNIMRELRNVVRTDDFSTLRGRAQNEFLLIPLFQSEYISSASNFLLKLFERDTQTLKEVGFCYFFAKMLKVHNWEELIDIMMACIFKDIGLTQIPYGKIRSFEDESYQKHTMYTIYVLKKAGLNLSDSAKRYILEHHEQINGQGFPRGKTEAHIAPYSQLISLVDQVFSLKFGRLDKKQRNLKQSIEMLKHRSEVPGLVYDFNINFLSSLFALLD